MTTQPLGMDVTSIEAMFELSKFVVPLSPGILTKMLSEGTANELVSLFSHEVARAIRTRLISSVTLRSVCLI